MLKLENKHKRMTHMRQSRIEVTCMEQLRLLQLQRTNNNNEDMIKIDNNHLNLLLREHKKLLREHRMQIQLQTETWMPSLR